jgi:hypothetical protein
MPAQGMQRGRRKLKVSGSRLDKLPAHSNPIEILIEIGAM